MSEYCHISSSDPKKDDPLGYGLGTLDIRPHKIWMDQSVSLRRIEVYKERILNERRRLAYTGWFHGWTQVFEEFESGPGNYPAAIIEDDEGVIHVEYAGYTKFVEGPT